MGKLDLILETSRLFNYAQPGEDPIVTNIRAKMNEELLSTLQTRCHVTGIQYKIYKRGLSVTQFKIVSFIFDRTRKSRDEWVTGAEIIKKFGTGGDYGKLESWGLIRSKMIQQKGSPVSGWQITDLGISAVEKKIKVPRFVYLFQGNRVGRSKEEVVISI